MIKKKKGEVKIIQRKVGWKRRQVGYLRREADEEALAVQLEKKQIVAVGSEGERQRVIERERERGRWGISYRNQKGRRWRININGTKTKTSCAARWRPINLFGSGYLFYLFGSGKVREKYSVVQRHSATAAKRQWDFRDDDNGTERKSTTVKQRFRNMFSWIRSLSSSN